MKNKHSIQNKVFCIETIYLIYEWVSVSGHYITLSKFFAMGKSSGQNALQFLVFFLVPWQAEFFFLFTSIERRENRGWWMNSCYIVGNNRNKICNMKYN